MPLPVLLLWGLIISAVNVALVAADDKTPATTQLPPPKSPAQALSAFTPRPGMQVELVAAEPLVADPVDIAWGPDGKLWVVEMADYPLGMDGRGQPGGRVRCLEDTTGDGRYDRSTVFLDGIPFPTGVMPWRGGVLVSAAPAVLFAEDTTGDGRADRQTSLYTGFGEGNQQHRVNGLRWGLDNWIYLANGDSEGAIRSAKTGEVVDIRGRDLRIRPDTGKLDPQTGRAQFGRNRDDWGNWFGCNNSRPIWHYVLADHYLRRNPRVVPPRPIVEISDPPGAGPVFPTSETLERFNDFDRANRFTSACGTMIYRDNLLGDVFAGNAFICEPVHNLVHREILKPHNFTFASRRADDEQRSEFLASSDNWFRPTVAKTGPDGALWIVDMYRLVIEHPQWIPEEWQRRLNLRDGDDRGRIYRVLPQDKSPREVPKLADLSAVQLVAHLETTNGWQRDMVQQLLVWRGDAAATEHLEAMLAGSQLPQARLHALCALDGIEALTPKHLRLALGDAHPGVRRHAIRLCERWTKPPAELQQSLLALSSDNDPQVQLQLACSLGAWKDMPTANLFVDLASRHAQDPYFLAALVSSLHEGNIDDIAKLLLSRVAHAELQPLLTDDVLVRLLAAIAASQNESGLKSLVSQLLEETSAAPTKTHLQVLSGVLAAAKSQPMLRIESLSLSARNQLERTLEHARKLAISTTQPEDDRTIAVALLSQTFVRATADADLLLKLLSPRQPPAIQSAAVTALSDRADEMLPAKLLADWNSHTPAIRAQILSVLMSRPAWTNELLTSIESGAVRSSHLTASTRQLLLNHRDARVKARAVELLADASPSSRAEVVAQFQHVLSMDGDVQSGRKLFEQKCAACHQLQGLGKPVGPDLAALTDRSAAAMLTAILDPNRAVEDKFLEYVALLDDGRLLNGLLVEETGVSLTLQSPDGKQHAILRSELDELYSSGKSFMPEGFEKDLTAAQFADIIAFVRNVPSRSPGTP